MGASVPDQKPGQRQSQNQRQDDASESASVCKLEESRKRAHEAEVGTESWIHETGCWTAMTACIESLRYATGCCWWKKEPCQL